MIVNIVYDTNGKIFSKKINMKHTCLESPIRSGTGHKEV